MTPRYWIALRGHGRQAFDERRGVGATVRLDKAEHHVDAAALQRVRLLEHAVGLAHARREPDVQLEPAPLGAAEHLEEVLGALEAIGIARSGHGR